ncbi:DUF1016 domain-containing protein [Arachidicoccus ginsenosidivorans]|uniref:DUF1016 domain-containing protein n=1 Tax=Arachidicoccus ginsenosidivorans TaxID=496057 RepID=A0A5B8VRW7_9BACT|nr:DUF1016 domain-containing protein [Arachidicoccus ginsenosidivorans]
MRNFRLFYLTFPNLLEIQQTVSAKLTWTHFQLIISVSDEAARNYYLKALRSSTSFYIISIYTG